MSPPLQPVEFILLILVAAALLLWLTSIPDEEPAAPPCSWRRMFRYKVRRHNRDYYGVTAWSFGLRVGYWPCLRAPFVEAAFAIWKVQVWHGYADREMFARGDA